MNTQTLQIGQKIHCTLYGGRDGYITRITGEQRPDTCKTLLGGIGVTGGNAELHIVFPTYFSKVPESLVRNSVQWRIYQDIIDADNLEIEMDKTRLFVGSQEMLKNQAELEKQIEEARQHTAPEYKHLTPCGEYDSTATAKNIRSELKKLYPGVKFSVRKSSHQCINVEWIDGPARDAVETALANFKDHNGTNMDDSLIYKHHAWIFGTVTYLFCQQSHSDDALQSAIDKVNSRYNNTGTVEQYRNGTLPILCQGADCDGYIRELRKVLSGEVDYELEDKHYYRSQAVRNLLNADFGFTGGYTKPGSEVGTHHQNGIWYIGYHDGEQIIDNFEIPVIDIARQINEAYDRQAEKL